MLIRKHCKSGFGVDSSFDTIYQFDEMEKYKFNLRQKWKKNTEGLNDANMFIKNKSSSLSYSTKRKQTALRAHVVISIMWLNWFTEKEMKGKYVATLNRKHCTIFQYMQMRSNQYLASTQLRWSIGIPYQIFIIQNVGRERKRKSENTWDFAKLSEICVCGLGFWS